MFETGHSCPYRNGRQDILMSTCNVKHMHHWASQAVTFSPIGDISLRRIFPLSISPMNSPMVSSSRMIKMNGSQMLHDLILGLAVLPSRSLMLCRSVPSKCRCQQCPPRETDSYVPGSSTLITLVTLNMT